MEALLDRNANPFAKDADGDTPLHRAVYSGWVGICEAIVRRSPDTIASVDAAGRTPRQVADARRTVAPRGGRQHWDAVAALLRGAEEKAETVRYPHHSGGDGSGSPDYPACVRMSLPTGAADMRHAMVLPVPPRRGGARATSGACTAVPPTSSRDQSRGSRGHIPRKLYMWARDGGGGNAVGGGGEGCYKGVTAGEHHSSSDMPYYSSSSKDASLDVVVGRQPQRSSNGEGRLLGRGRENETATADCIDDRIVVHGMWPDFEAGSESLPTTTTSGNTGKERRAAVWY